MLEQITNSPNFYSYVYIAVLLLTVFNAAEILFLLWNKHRVESMEARKLTLKRRAAELLITSEDPASELPKPVREEDFAAYAEAAASVLDSFEGDIAARASALVQRLGVGTHYKVLSRRGAWYKRAAAIDILSAFRLTDSRQFFLDTFRRENSSEVKYRLIYGLSLLVTDHAEIKELAERLSSLPYLTSKYTEDVFYNIIISLKLLGREQEFGRFMSEIMKDEMVTVLVKRDCLSACYAAICEHGAPLVRAYYDHYRSEPEITVACIKALSKAADFSKVPEALGNPDWRVRMTAAKYAHLAAGDLLPVLRGLLKDPNYHVRINAALALSRMGDGGLAVLREESCSKDKFAAETAAYALGVSGACA